MNRIQNVFAHAGWGRTAAALFAVTLALAGLANAETHKAKKGRLKITAATEIGGVNLQPGDYRVREVNSAEGPVMEFVLESYNPAAPEGLSPYDEEVVARVKFTEQALSAVPRHTQLELASTEAAALQIRGDAVEYVFASPAMAAPSAMAAPANSAAVCASGGLRR